MSLTTSKEYQDIKENLDNRRTAFISLGSACYDQRRYDYKLLESLNQTKEYIDKYVTREGIDWMYCVFFFKKLNVDIQYYLGFFDIGRPLKENEGWTVSPSKQRIEKSIPSLLSYFLLNTIESYMANQWHSVYHESHTKKTELLIRKISNGSIASYRRLSLFLDKETLEEVSKRSVKDKKVIISNHINQRLEEPKVKAKINKDKEKIIEEFIQERTKDLIEEGERKLQEIFDFEVSQVVVNLSIKRTNTIIESIIK